MKILFDKQQEFSNPQLTDTFIKFFITEQQDMNLNASASIQFDSAFNDENYQIETQLENNTIIAHIPTKGMSTAILCNIHTLSIKVNDDEQKFVVKANDIQHIYNLQTFQLKTSLLSIPPVYNIDDIEQLIFLDSYDSQNVIDYLKYQIFQFLNVDQQSILKTLDIFYNFNITNGNSMVIKYFFILMGKFINGNQKLLNQLINAFDINIIVLVNTILIFYLQLSSFYDCESQFKKLVTQQDIKQIKQIELCFLTNPFKFVFSINQVVSQFRLYQSLTVDVHEDITNSDRIKEKQETKIDLDDI